MKRALAALLLLAGCTVGPNFQQPHPDLPARYAGQPDDLPSRTFGGAVDTRWWALFGDPELASLVDRLAKQNLDLQAAAERVRQARADRDVAASQGLPHLDASPRYTRERESPNGTPSLIEPAPNAPLTFNLFQPMVTASWELDLFGRVRRAVEAANARTAAAVEARNGIALSAIAELAQDYLMLRQLQAQEAVVRHSVAAADDRIRLTRNRFANGVATTLEVAQAEAQGTSIAQSLPELRQQQAAMVNAIGVLLALPPGALEDELQHGGAQPPVPPTVPVGLPADLVRRRPDVRQAEAELHAATAETGVAVASFFPDITLNGSAGFESLHTGNLFIAASRVDQFGPTLSLPIFHGGQLTGQLRLRKSQQREAALQYRKTVIQALNDVDDALTGYAEAQRGRADAASTVAADTRALTAAEQQYGEGVATFLDVVTAQQALFQAQNGAVQAEARVEQALVALFRALGGGWQAVAPAPASAAPAKARG